MVKNNSIPPEERLLKTIESPSPKVKREKVFNFSPDEIVSKVKDFIELGWKEKKFTELNYINKAMIGLSGVVTVVFIINFFLADARLSNYLKDLDNVSSITERKQEFTFSEGDLEGSLKQVDTRNVFLPYGVSEAKPIREQEEAAPPKSLNDFNLVGIIWSGNPQAMIEDVQKQKTHLVNKGDSVEGFHIKDIEKNAVILERDGKTWSLR